MQIPKVQIFFRPFLLALTRCPYSPLPPLVFTLMAEFKQWNRGKRRQMWLCGKLLCHSDLYGNHIFFCSLWEGDLFFQHFEKDLWFHLDLCTIAFLSVLFIFPWELSDKVIFLLGCIKYTLTYSGIKDSWIQRPLLKAFCKYCPFPSNFTWSSSVGPYSGWAMW